MKKNQKRFRIFFRYLGTLLLSGFLLAGCTETRYVNYREGTSHDDLPFRVVAYEIDPSFHEEFPTCVLILPPGPGDRITVDLSRIIETALARQIMRRFDRVIDGQELRNAVERYGFDIDDRKERRSLTGKLGCDAYIRTEVLDPRMDYLLVWSQIGVGLELQLRRSIDDHLLWRARHKARRSEGGLSFSPLGILVDSVFSSRFAADREVAESLVDDALRRMVVPLPDTRSF